MSIHTSGNIDRDSLIFGVQYNMYDAKFLHNLVNSYNIHVSSNTQLMVAIASSFKVSPDTLRVLHTSTQYVVRMAVAENRFAPEDVLDSLVHDKYLSVLEALVNNPSVVDKQLDILSTCYFDVIRKSVAEKTKSRDVLTRLTQDSTVGVREAAIANPNCPIELKFIYEMEK